MVLAPDLAPDTLNQAVRLLVDAARPKKIILFGSYARGEQTPDSDLDLLVILPDTPDHFTEMVRLRRALKPIRMPIDVLVYSEDNVKKRGHWLGTALFEALREGRSCMQLDSSRTPGHLPGRGSAQSGR